MFNLEIKKEDYTAPGTGNILKAKIQSYSEF